VSEHCYTTFSRKRVLNPQQELYDLLKLYVLLKLYDLLKLCCSSTRQSVVCITYNHLQCFSRTKYSGPWSSAWLLWVVQFLSDKSIGCGQLHFSRFPTRRIFKLWGSSTQCFTGECFQRASPSMLRIYGDDTDAFHCDTHILKSYVLELYETLLPPNYRANFTGKNCLHSCQQHVSHHTKLSVTYS